MLREFPTTWAEVAPSPGGPAGLIVIASAPRHPPGHVAQLNAQVVGPVGVTVSRINFSASLVCEILVDDNYGAHIPGAYARAGALVRQGGSFVNR
jgi:hypothetical protein